MRQLLVSAIALALAASPVISTAAATGAPSVPAPSGQAQATTQLPRNVRPTHYDVAIVPHAQAMNFDGKVTVAIDVLAPTSSITLNAINMHFNKVALTAATGGAAQAPAAIKVDADAQTATFSFARPIAVGSYRLAMDYRGKIGTQANGLFAIDYATKAGNKRALYTQFENSDARQLIPSWDEPAFKTTFTLEATVPSALMAVSNMPVAKRTELGGGMARVRFQTSPKMSTYLLFFGLGDFERATAQADGTEVGVVTQRGAVSQAAFALKSAQDVLHEYNDYFATPYPLPKLDNIASPGGSQFFGAMENWGAIYTFEAVILLDPTISTESDKHRAFEVAAHEMAHQWFGDLVTMQWWDDLWLNEGFASWMEGRTTARLHPEWNTALSAVEGRESAMRRDAVASTHPVVQHVETVEQASQAFDAITYQKGKAVIGMLEGYVGADAWRDGVRRYMKAHAYGNTVSDDLWREVEAASGKPIMDIAHQFTLQPGVPMIRVDAATCKDGSTTLALSQDEFTVDRPGKQALRWQVPVIAATVGSSESVRAMVDGKATLAVPGCGAAIVNAGQSGYYRTLYAPAQFDAIKNDFAKLAPIDQLGVMSDSWSLGLAGLQPASDFLDLAAATPADADTQVWGKIAEVFGNIDDYYIGDAARQQAFRQYAIARLSPVLAKLGWIARDGEPDTVSILRGDLIATLGDLGDPAVIAEARRRYAAQASDPAAVPAALRKVIISVIARNADAAQWEQLHAAARAETTALVRDQLYARLATTQDEALARRALDLALTPEPGATNTSRMIATVADLHPDLAFDFAIAHLAAVDVHVDATSRSRYYPALGGGSADPAMIEKIRSYADAHLAKGSRRSADTAIAGIEYRIKVRKERLPAIDAWLRSHAKS
jgi:aminopeptidase N